MNILIIDDDDKNRKLLRVVLQSNGYETIEAENGEDGIKLAKEKNPSLILMDVQMPVMDGITVMKILKSEKSMAGIPIIALTSHAMKGDKERFLEAGFDGNSSINRGSHFHYELGHNLFC
jgi:two-component system cell cycle response regulator DivK